MFIVMLAPMIIALFGALYCLGVFDMLSSSTEETEPEKEQRKIHLTENDKSRWELHCKNVDFDGHSIKTAPCFTAEQAILFYNTAPQKWWRATFAIYYLPTGRFSDKETTLITFPNIEEYVKFMRFLDKQDELAKQKEQIQNTLNILPYLQADAKHAQEAADQEMANCEEKVRDIYKRIQQEQTRSI